MRHHLGGDEVAPERLDMLGAVASHRDQAADGGAEAHPHRGHQAVAKEFGRPLERRLPDRGIGEAAAARRADLAGQVPGAAAKSDHRAHQRPRRGAHDQVSRGQVKPGGGEGLERPGHPEGAPGGASRQHQPPRFGGRLVMRAIGHGANRMVLLRGPTYGRLNHGVGWFSIVLSDGYRRGGKLTGGYVLLT